MRMRLYLCGKIGNWPKDIVHEDFRLAMLALASHGYQTLNPFIVSPIHIDGCGEPGDNGKKHELCNLRGEVAAMMACHGVALLPTAYDSFGAQREIKVAQVMGLPVHAVLTWVRMVQFPDTPVRLDQVECSCVMTPASQFNCPVHGTDEARYGG